MRGLAGFVMQGRLRAALVAAAFAVVSLIFAPAIILSGAAVALVTLRRGSTEGLIVAAAGAIGSAVLAGLALGNPMSALWLVVVFWVPLWVVSVVLRSSVSLSLTIQVLLGIAVCGVLALFLALGDAAGWWRDLLGTQLAPMLLESGMSEELIAALIEVSAPLMTGMLVGNVALSLLTSLFLARYWQAVLYNPGGFGEEFRDLRLGRAVSVLALILAGYGYLTEMLLVVNLVVAIVALVAVHGLAVVHGGVRRAKASRAWLVGVYGLSFFFLPEFLAVMCLLGIVDAWVDLRARIPGV